MKCPNCKMELEKFRELKINSSQGFREAMYLICNNDSCDSNLFLFDEEKLLEGYQGSRWTCGRCVHYQRNRNHSEFLKNINFSKHSRRICNPLPWQVGRCDLIQNKYKDYDILIHTNNCCGNFTPIFNFEDWNVNQFFTTELCCRKNNIVNIDSIVYNELQTPFDLYASGQDFWNLDFIKEDKIEVKKLVNWDEFTFKNKEYASPTHYKTIIKDLYGSEITLNELKAFWKMKCNNGFKGVFDFKKGWFVENIWYKNLREKIAKTNRQKLLKKKE